MKITILETGRPPEALRADFPDYPAMFRAWLSQAAPDFRFETVTVCDGASPPDPAILDAVLITGSPAGAYDLEPWIAPLEDFIRRAAMARTPLVGICFGHQIIAQALGGKVEKSAKGWGVGRHGYEIIAPQPWMDPALPRFALAASHQDQVVAPPAGATTFARSAHTEFAGLVYEDAPILTFQGHPEMRDDFTAALVASRRGRIADDLVDAALASLAAPGDAAIAANWVLRFLRSARSSQRPLD